MSWKTTLTIGRFTWTTDQPELLPELQIMAPTEPKMESELSRLNSKEGRDG